MAKVTVVTRDKARSAPLPEGLRGACANLAYLSGADDPLHLSLATLADGESLVIGPRAVDCLVYVWTGAVSADGVALPAGSSLLVEHGRMLELTGAGQGAELLLYTAAPGHAEPRAGGHVHLLPVDRVPRAAQLPGASGVGGGIHFDSACATCEIWLHENHFPPSEPLTPEQEARGVHCHSEDEIIFVTAGSMLLGRKRVGPGTALAIHADTMYSFQTGPDGLSFVNFRAGTPGDIRFANGMSISETGYWRDKLPRPEYVEVA